MSEHAQPAFNVYRKDPLMRAIASTGISPVLLGVAFFFCISLTLSIWGFRFKPAVVPELYLPFLYNISWSISIIFLFPLVMALSLKYALEIPLLFEFLFDKFTHIPEGAKETDDYYRWLDARFNSYWTSGLIFVLTLVLNAIYFFQILNPPPPDEGQQALFGWMTSGELLGFLSDSGRGLTAVGVYAAVLQIILIYWVLNLLWRGVILAWGLHEFFNKRDFPIRIEPLHPDGCCGLRRVGDVAMLLNLTLFLLGIYISLKVVDKVVIQNSELTADIGNPVMLVGYLILAPLLFFLPLGAAHRRMKCAKEDFLRPVSQRCEQLFGELSSAGLDDQGLTAVRTFSELENARNSLQKQIPVWPFDFKSLRAFIGTIIVPVIPVVLPFVMEFMAKIFPQIRLIDS